MKKLLKADIDKPDKIIKYRLFNLKIPAHRSAAIKLVKAAEKIQKAKEKGKNKPSTSYQPHIDKNNWQTASETVKKLLAAQSPIDGKIVLRSSSTVHTLGLPFYRNSVYLVRVSPDWEPSNLFLYFLYDGKKLIRLNGTSPPIHQFNASHALMLETSKQAENYLWFFNFFIRAADGPFLLFETLSDRYVPTKLDVANKRKIKAAIQPITCKEKSNKKHYSCNATIYYSNAVFLADYTVDMVGKVDMFNDQPIAADLKYRIDAPITLSEVKSETFSQKDESKSNRIIGYQVGVRHVMDTTSCPNPKIKSYALSDALLPRFTDTEALTRIYSEAIWWVRLYCDLPNGQTAKMDIELIVGNATIASIKLEHREKDSNGNSLWWAKGLKVTDSKIGSKKPVKGVVPKYLELVTNTLLEKNNVAKRKIMFKQLLKFNYSDLKKMTDPTIAFELARIKSSKIVSSGMDISSGNGTLYFEEYNSKECPEDETLMQRAADLGSAPAAFLIARCGVKVEYLRMGKDLQRIVRKYAKNSSGVDPYDRFMFHITKSILAGYAPALGLMESANGYTDEIEDYRKLISPHGLSYSFGKYIKDHSKEPNREFISPPSKAELMSKLNHDILMNSCSKLNMFLGSEVNPATFALSSVKGINGWCVASNFGAKTKIRVGKIIDSTCDKKEESNFTCKIKYRLGCEIDSFKSTTKGNQLICNMFTSVSIPGEVKAARGKDGVLTINAFRAGGSQTWLYGR